MKFPHLILVSLLVLFLTGCGKDDPVAPTTPKDKDPIAIAPRITNLSQDYLIEGDQLTISGTNFNQADFETKIFVNGSELAPTSLTKEEITVIIDTEEGGPSNVVIEVDGRKSEAAFLYILNKGWNKLVLDREREFKKAMVLDNDDDIYVMGDLEPGSSSFYNVVFKLSPTFQNFKEQAIPDIMNGSLSNFEIDSTGKAAVTNGYTLQLFENKFETERNRYLAAAVEDPGSGQRMSILLDHNEVFYSNYMHTYGYSNDFGNTNEKGYTDWLSSSTENGNSFYGAITSVKKAPSDGKVYGIGVYRKGWKYGSASNIPDTNIIMQSDDYINWEVLDTVTVNTEHTLYNGKFFDSNLILTTDAESNLLRSSDLAKTWSTVRQGIKRFYFRSENEWYAITSENQVISTGDGGQTWNTELEFEESDVISHINFSKTKLVVSGYGFMYVKYE